MIHSADFRLAIGNQSELFDVKALNLFKQITIEKVYQKELIVKILCLIFSMIIFWSIMNHQISL